MIAAGAAADAHGIAAAAEAKIQGDVVLSAAVAALQQWTFKPGTKDGRAVDVEVHFMIRFTLA